MNLSLTKDHSPTTILDAKNRKQPVSPSESSQITGGNKQEHHNTMQYLPWKRQARHGAPGRALKPGLRGKGEVLGSLLERVTASSAS